MWRIRVSIGLFIETFVHHSISKLEAKIMINLRSSTSSRYSYQEWFILLLFRRELLLGSSDLVLRSTWGFVWLRLQNSSRIALGFMHIYYRCVANYNPTPLCACWDLYGYTMYPKKKKEWDKAMWAVERKTRFGIATEEPTYLMNFYR